MKTILIISAVVLCAGIALWVFRHRPATIFREGQVWHYKNRPGEDQSTFTILKTELWHGKPIMHIRVDSIHIQMMRDTLITVTEVPHLPFAEEAVRLSATDLVTTVSQLPDYQEGYDYWHEEADSGHAGVFTISIAEAINAMDATVSKGKAAQ